MDKDTNDKENLSNIQQMSSEDLKQPKNNTKFRLYNKYESIDLSITSDFYANISYIKAEEIKNYLKQTSNHGLTGLKNLGNI